ncbi:MAG: DNA-binding protein [Planctomycetota bacterium]|nr:DNA-binding protein [Planctomycetota bacterium]
MIVKSHTLKRFITLRLGNGKDLLESLEEAVKRESIRNALILAGFGSVASYHFHVVADSNLPPENAFVKGESALDVVQISGAVIDGRVHAHILFTDDKTALGGHVEPGCRVLTFIVVTMQEVEGVDMADWDGIGKLP